MPTPVFCSLLFSNLHAITLIVLLLLPFSCTALYFLNLVVFLCWRCGNKRLYYHYYLIIFITLMTVRKCKALFYNTITIYLVL